MSIEQKKKALIEKADRVSEMTMLLKLSKDSDDSIMDFREIEGIFEEADLSQIIRNEPFKIPVPDGQGGKITVNRYYDDYLTAAEVMTYASDDDSDYYLYKAIVELRQMLGEVRRKPWIREKNPERVDEIIAGKIQNLQNTMMRAERSHVRYGKTRFALAVEAICNKRIIPVESKTLATVENRQSREDEGYPDEDENPGGGVG